MNFLHVSYDHPTRGHEVVTFETRDETPEEGRSRVLSYLWSVEHVDNIEFLSLQGYLVCRYQKQQHVHKNCSIDEFQTASQGG